jgi:uncharacterized protein
MRGQIVGGLIALSLGVPVLAGDDDSAHASTPPDPTVHQIYEEAEKGNLAKAQQMIEVVIRHHPASGKAHFVQAELYYREHKIDMARDQLATAESLSPGLPTVNPHAVEELKKKLKPYK